MKKIYRMIAICGICVGFHNAYSAIPNNSHPLTFLGPTFSARLTGLLTDDSGYSFLAEAGERDLRASGSVGVNICDVHHVKLTAEYFGQRITYPFFNRNRRIANQEGDIGAAYQFDINPFVPWNPQLDVNAYYANSPAASFGSEQGTFINRDGILRSFDNTERLAESNATGISSGFSIQPWYGGKAGLALNYDEVRYDMKYKSNVTAKGFGGTALFRQQLKYDVATDVSAAIRKPFNNYQADIAWYAPTCDGLWEFKLFGAYTIGKHTLPDTYNAGLSASYFLDRKEGTTLPEQAKQEFLAWMAKPAIYLPEVLTIPDERTIFS